MQLIHAVGPSGGRSAIVFLHGLDGSPNSSWGHASSDRTLPRDLRSTLPGRDIILVDYACRLSEFASNRDLNVASLGRLWAEVFDREIAPRYRRLLLVMHCLGGMVMAEALQHLYSRLPCLDTVWIDVPLTPPTSPAEDRICKIMAALGMNGEKLTVNLASARRAISDREMRPFSVASAWPGWIDPFTPLALHGGPSHRLAADHADLPRPAGGEQSEITALITDFARQTQPADRYVEA